MELQVGNDQPTEAVLSPDSVLVKLTYESRCTLVLDLDETLIFTTPSREPNLKYDTSLQ